VRGILLGLLVLLAAPAGAQPISVDDLRLAIEGIESALDRGDLEAAREGARGLTAATVQGADGGTLTPDPTLFVPLAEASTLPVARALSGRLGALRRALDSRGEPAAGPVDRALLERMIAANTEERRKGEGFEIGEDGGVLQALGDLLRPVRDFIAKVWREFWEWVADAFRPSKGGSWLAGIPLPSLVEVLVVVFAGALAILAVRAWRARRRPAPASALELAAGPAADDDPLSRDEGGWRRYAQELARAGRTREAIRAWYHAVLVALYGRGLVSYRKGRTNWELVAALSPALAFRPSLIELTRLFDREWYGLRQSPPEALGEAEDLAVDLLSAIEPARSAA
jgi:hypothetical protein